jgi:hypothetical protein
MDPYSGKARQAIHKPPMLSGLTVYSLQARQIQVYFSTLYGLTAGQKPIYGLTVFGLTVATTQVCSLIAEAKPVSGSTVSGLTPVWTHPCSSTASGLTQVLIPHYFSIVYGLILD